MDVKVFDITGKEKGKTELPEQFNEEVREDLIKKAFLAIMSHKRQPYGAWPMAGKTYVAWTSKRRRDYRGSYGYGISRTPKKVLTRRGMRFYWVGAFAPNTVGGRRAHPPKAEKKWAWKINDKERRKAIRSAMSATMIREIVETRGHKVPENYPFIVDESIEKVSKTKELRKILETLGFKEELERAEKKKIRAGKGKMRGRRYRKKKSILIVASDTSILEKAAKNIPGIDVVRVDSLNVELLAPGTHPGRVTLYTTNAIEKLRKEKLYM